MTCQPAPQLLMEAIAEGILDPAVHVAASVAVPVDVVRRNNRGWPELIVALRIIGAEQAVSAVFATAASGGPIFALDGAAREYTSWGVAGREQSRAGEKRRRLLGYPEVGEARRCLEEI